ncbi:MAG: hypothetical protein JNJ54_14600 [Myxococcaceae bacterium]|nr:hypothetical protein [Myxococcaceae bacterium]
MTARPRLASLLGPEPTDNALRYAGAPHVESYFLRANDPERPRAFWLKQCILAPVKGPAVAESWFIWFDGERNRTIAQRHQEPLEGARFAPDDVLTNAMTLRLGAEGFVKGEVNAPEGRARFDLTFRKDASPAARPLSIFPWRLLRSGPFPRAKPLTPFPFLRFSGALELPGETVQVKGWPGMQGHNWGNEHTFEYAWGQCLFPEADAMVEGFSARVKVAGRLTPRLSALVVQKGPRVYRFDAIFDGWRQRATVDQDTWTVALRGDDGDVSLSMDARRQPMVCLGYDNPDGERTYCFNSKLAAVELTVRPSDGASFTLTSSHGGALEFLRRQPDPRFSRVV